MDYFAWAIGLLVDAYNEVVIWIGQLLAACGVTTIPVYLGLFAMTVIMAVIILPIRGAALSDMARNEWTMKEQSSGKYASGHRRWFGGSKGKYSK